MNVNFDASMPRPFILKESIRGVKRILHYKEWALLRHSRAKKIEDVNEHAKRGADIARRVRQLKEIIRHLEIMEVISKYQKLRTV